MTTLDAPTDTALDLARECLYRFFAAALGDPRGPGWDSISSPDDRWVAGVAADLIRSEAMGDPVPLGFGERPPDDLDLFNALTELRRPADELATEYDRAFGLVTTSECTPYETEYLSTEEAFFRGQHLADVAGFYRAYGLTGSRTRPERPDHVAMELEYMAHLLFMRRVAPDDDRAAICDDAARRFFRDHLAWWLPSFATGLQRRTGGGLYSSLASALAAFLPTERSYFGIKAPQLPVRPRPNTPEESESCTGCAVSA